MKTERVLVHIDTAQVSDTLMQKIMILAQKKGTMIELFSCCYNQSLHRSYLFDDEAEKHAVAGYLHQAEAKLIRLAEQLEAQGGQVSYDVTWNRNVAEGLIRKALRYRADIVVFPIGRHSHGHYLFRQGDWQLIAQCPTPLLLIRDQQWAVHPRVAALVDPFHQCEEPQKLDNQVLKNSQVLSRLLVAEQHVVHSFATIPQAAIFDEHLTIDYAAMHEKVKQQHTDVLQAMVSKDVILHLEQGDVHAVIPALVKRENIDLLVMGSISRGFLDRFLVGSSVERIVGHVDCDFLLVKQPGFVSPITE
ncbi:universal stress protein [Neptunomonas japonica]|uniref:Universal stress protein E n=1 Tax=Neptunomonas japonica JAMM 1380 TaxID=1441457 RepID=A0A7R6SWZ7_9GAMM|nr:universal stress protein [Neptunomonas japonica]BBB30167.1 universal stress protein E [Neptunomonas japonica JAMM 1380]